MTRRLALLAFLVGTLSSTAFARVDRTVVREHQATRAALRAQLRAASGAQEHVTGTLFHQVRDVSAREELKAQIATSSSKSTMLRGWMPKGNYPGIWTTENPEGFFRTTAGAPFEITLKPGALLYDHDKPEHRAVYEAWKKLDAKTRGPNAENRFTAMKSADGRTLATRVGGVHAPEHERFYREMGIAGVGWWNDAYGERSVVLLNPREIASVKAPAN